MTLIEGIGGRRFSLAILVVLASFILISYMLIQQNQMTDRFFNIMESENFDNATSTNLVEAFEKIDKSNQTIFNIMLPVFSVWVGVVIAFYFSSRNLDKAQKATEEAQKVISKLATGKGGDITLEELLRLHPESKNVQIVELNDDKKVVEVKAKVFGNVLVVDEGKILGVLYLKDFENAKDRVEELKKVKDGKKKELKKAEAELKKAGKSKNAEEKVKKIEAELKEAEVELEKAEAELKKEGKFQNGKLGEFFVNKAVTDHVTDEVWTVKGLEKENYARVSYQDKISEARTKMEQVKPESKLGEFDVLGLVFVKEDVDAAINYKTLLRYF